MMWIGPSAVIDAEKLDSEMQRNRKLASPVYGGQTYVHPCAVVVTEDDKLAEQESAELTAIGSTAQGTMFAKLAKLRRANHGVLHPHPSSDLPNLSAVDLEGDTGCIVVDSPEDFYNMAHARMLSGLWLHEVSQGYLLSVDHGQYPYVTSKNCTTQNACDDFQIPPHLVGDVYLVVRSFPIRVGNGGGFSGPMPWCVETDWDTIIRNAGMNDAQAAACRQYEITTVTKRVRRVGEITDMSIVRDAARRQGATKLVLQFANYIDAACWGARTPARLTLKVWEFIHRLEEASGVRVALVGTGPELEDMVEL